MTPSLRLVSSVVNQNLKDWTVREEPWPGPEQEQMWADDWVATSSGEESRQQFIRVLFRCSSPSRPNAEFVVQAVMTATRTRDSSDQEGWRSPWSLRTNGVERITVENVSAEDSGFWRDAGLVGVASAIKDHMHGLSLRNPEMFGDSRALPSPGAKGLPPVHYAVWAQRYAQATAQHGRGYMLRLLEQYPGETRSNLLRKIERARKLGLLEVETQPGKVGVARLTSKALDLLKAEGDQ